MPAASRPTLLLTRPEADSRRFAALLPEFPSVISPVLRIVPVEHDAEALQRAPGLVFTSAHAVAAAGPGRGRLAICVGGHTAMTARQAGYEVRTGNGFAESLPPLIAAAGVALVHPHGRHLARRLPVAGMVVYDQVPQPLDAAARALLCGPSPVLLPLFSPRSARLVDEQIAMHHGALRAPLLVAAISEAVARAFSRPVAAMLVADAPEAGAMIRAIRQLAGGNG